MRYGPIGGVLSHYFRHHELLQMHLSLLRFGSYAPGGAMTGGVVANLSVSEIGEFRTMAKYCFQGHFILRIPE